METIFNKDNKLNVEEVNLWRAVINQAFTDLKINSDKKKIYRVLRRKAAEWLTLESEDFLIVCQYACLDSGYVKRKAKEIIRKISKTI